MFRRIVAMAMLISFIAMSSSGIMMFVVEQPSFTIQMHPVHKVFGIVMTVAAIAHLSLNFRYLKAHIQNRSAIVAACVLTAALVVLYGVALKNTVPPELAKTMDAAALAAERGNKSK